MAATVNVDTMRDVSLNEEGGVITDVTRSCVIQDLNNASGDFTVLQEALDALDTAGFTAGSALTGYENLILIKRDVQVDQNSQTAARATLKFEAIWRTWTRLTLNNGFIFSGGTSLQQDTTSLDFFGDQITVEHEFPSDDPDFPDETKVQGVAATVLLPKPTLVAAGKIATAYPDTLSQEWAGQLNSAIWRGAPPLTWLCSNVTFQPSDTSLSTNTWDFVFEFMYSADGWDPQVIYIDSRTGKPPPDLIDGTGYKTLEWYGSFDFNSRFPI